MPKITATPEQALTVSQIPFHKEGDQWLFVKCPFHNGDEDKDIKDANGRVHQTNGAYKCFVCGKPTNVFNFIAAKLGKHVENVRKAINAAVSGVKGVPPEQVDEWHSTLAGSTEYLGRLRDKHGINIDTVIKYKLGLAHNTKHGGRITVPVYNGDNDIVNVRQYSYAEEDRKRKMISLPGCGASLYPIPDKGVTDIYIAEGEFKALLLRQYGFHAITNTAGAGHWDAEYNNYFGGANVLIVYDTDAAGETGALAVAAHLVKVALSVRIVRLPLSGTKEDNDVTDYFVKRKATVDDFRKLCIAAQVYTVPDKPDLEEDDPKIYDTTLSNSSSGGLFNKRVKFTAVISAKSTAPFIVPSKAKVVCDANNKYCIHCHVIHNRNYEFSIASDSRHMLTLINTNKKGQNETLKALSGVYPKCQAVEFKVEESNNVEELRLIPQISVGHSTGEMVVRKAYAVAHGLDTNFCYEFEARVCVEPDTQQATLIAYKSDRTGDDIDSFTITPELHDLTAFQPSEWTKEALAVKLDEIHGDISANVTKIYSRPDLHMFYDMVWYSLLYVPFQGKTVKGYVDALCIGDSGQGKSECSIRLSNHYKCGERVDTKRASVAGLLGGLQETGNRWFVTWGTIPLNDRRLVILEECKGMATEAIAVLTDMRSSGVAEIQKIERAKTNARTRLIWISNCRSDRNIDNFNYGVDAVRELIGNLEDIRRFDMVMAVSKNDVAYQIINIPTHLREKVDHVYTSELSQQLVLWAWSRTEKDVEYEDGFEQCLLNAATAMSGRYSSGIPIVEPADQRHKLLRLAGALACRTFSTDDGVKVKIRKCHIEVVVEFLDRIYGSKSLGYLDYSTANKAEGVMRDVDDVIQRIRNMPNASDSVLTMVETDALNAQVVMDCTEWTKEVASEFIGFLVRKHSIKPLRRGGYRKTSAFIELLKKLDREGLDSQTLSEQIAKGNF